MLPVSFHSNIFAVLILVLEPTFTHSKRIDCDKLLFLQVPIATAEAVSNLRVRFCLEANDVLCGSYAEAKLVDVSPAVGGSGNYK